ncbi:MAG: hypothetical protein M1835_001525 [Candelina submexicana]|nr:MAG: hypothetical protein M1835_001525 [Candelina submexicana]
MGLWYIPQILGLNGANPIQYLQSQFLTGQAAGGSVTVYATDDVRATGNPLFSAIHHVSVTPATTGIAVSTDLRTVTASVAAADATAISVAVFGEPIVPADEQSTPPAEEADDTAAQTAS